MKRIHSRHFSEEELLMHILREETATVESEISGHLLECGECTAVLNDYADVVARLQLWTAPEIAEGIWEEKKRILLELYRNDMSAGRRRGFWISLKNAFGTGWNYALENPLPTLAYIAVAVAFALERTITAFRLDNVVPGASTMFEFLRQVF